MKMAGLKFVAAAIACALCAQQANAATVAPVQKVLQMMSEMKAKGELMMEQEKKTYNAYAEWVSEQETELGFEIKTGNSDIEGLLADIAKADDDVAKLADAITALEDEQSTAEKEKR